MKRWGLAKGSNSTSLLRRIRTARVIRALTDGETTPAEVRACRISLGRESIDRLIASASCPHCREVHDPDISLSFRTLQEGWNALVEDGKAARAALREEKQRSK